MNLSWFYLVGTERIGPLSFEQLSAAGAAGLIRHDTLVCHSASDEWYPAGQVAGLLAPPPPAAPPVCALPHSVAGPVLPPPVQGDAPPPPAVGSSTREWLRELASPLITVSCAALAILLCAAIVIAGRSLWRPRPAPVEDMAAAIGMREISLPDADPSTVPVAEKPKKEPSADEIELARLVMGDNAAAKVVGTAPPREKSEFALIAEETAKPPEQRAKAPAANPFEIPGVRAPRGKIDELVFAKLKQLKIQPAELCSDGVFLRRVYLDIIGTLPGVEETKDFLDDNDPNKRRTLIDRLLARDEFADYWAMKWGDLLRVKAEFPINLWPYASQAYHRWIQACLRDNMPYDRFVREMLTASGSNFRVPQVNFYRALQNRQPQSIAQAVALTFMGMRADKWAPERLDGMAALFAQIKYKSTAEWKEEIILFDPSAAAQSKTGTAPAAAVFPDGTPAKISPEQDPREVFADWLIDAKNPWFAPQIVNRIWYWLLGRGIVHEPDDFRPDNPPQNPQLLDYLTGELVSSRYDMKHVYRLILNSTTYQLSSLGKRKGPESAANFGQYWMRRLEGEVLIDALCQITGTTETYSSLIPEPFTFIPEDIRTISLPDGSITSAFLEMFGRPPRDTGMESERNNRVTPAQRLHLLNSTHIRQKIERLSRFGVLAQAKGDPRKTVELLYLMILSRRPTDDEQEIIHTFVGNGQSGQKLVTDVAWALINSEEFLHRH